MGDLYKFKAITTLPNAKEFVDVVLSRTNRKTPTQVHITFKITRIRKFYMRKVKYTQQTIHDRLSLILEQFPRLNDIHPFYSHLCNVLYDKDYFKLALGQINAVRGVCNNVGRDYVRLMKYADSLFKCKMLKRAALGRMATALKKLQGSLTYLEEVRQHLSRLPSINPSSRTLILCGYPNVGKSSFMNRLTNANVEVEPYAFTTKSLYVGHFDHCYSRWQVIDTPGVLDHPMANRNKIEMQAITALAHVHAAVLYFLDISENCGYSLEAQVKLFHEIKVLFQHRPVVVLLNKVDLRSHSDLSAEELQMIRQMADGLPGVEFIPTSNVTAEGLQDAQVKACNALLMSRVEKKTQGKRGQEILDNTLHTVMPSEINVDRPPSIPTSILSQRQVIASGGKIPVRTTEKDLQEIHGGAGVYSMDDRKRYLLAKPEWKYDIMPEILDGRNVSDFVDPDVLDKLRELEKEEEQVLAGLSSEYYEDDPEWVHTQQILMELHEKIGLKKLATHEAKARTLKQRLGFMDTDVQEALGSLGYQTEGILSRAKAHEKFDNVRAFEQELDSSDEEVLTDEERDNIATPEEKQSFVKSVQAAKLKRKRNILQAMRLHGPVGQKARKLKPNRVDRAASTDEQRLKMAQATKRAIKTIGKTGVRGISDRAIQTKMPKHLFSGKRTIGKTDWR